MTLQYWKLYTQWHRILTSQYTGIHTININTGLQISIKISVHGSIQEAFNNFSPHNIHIFVSPQISVSAYLKPTFRFVVLTEQLLLKIPLLLKTLQLLLSRLLTNGRCWTGSQFIQNTQILLPIIVCNSPYLNPSTDSPIFTIYSTYKSEYTCTHTFCSWK